MVYDEDVQQRWTNKPNHGEMLEKLPAIGDPGHLETGEGCQSQCQDGSRSQSRLFWSSNIAAKSRSKTLMIFQDEEMPILTGNFSGFAVFGDTSIIVIVMVIIMVIVIVIIIIGYILCN